MKLRLFTLLTLLCAPFVYGVAQVSPTLFPANGAENVNVDTQLKLTFNQEVAVGNKGFVKVYDLTTGKLIDKLDLSIPAGPTQGQPKNPDAIYTPTPYIYKDEVITNRNTVPNTPSGAAKPTIGNWQWNIIGGFSDAFHFYPIIVHGNKATIYLHNNMLEYGHEYAVTIDKGVIDGFEG
ncbi:MAG: carbohydrate esterase, partial [Prevotella sp.]|nr:carbohydrate esterase [Prevotella sp.]